jgi:subtilisin family serine protease
MKIGMSFTLLMLFISCAPKQVEKFSAPKTQNQAGLIASCTTVSEAQAVAQDLNIQFRVINKKRKIIEFIGASEIALSEKLPRARFKQNKIYKNLLSGKFKALNTPNYPFYGAHTPEYRNLEMADYFPHLKQIDDVTPPNLSQMNKVVVAVIDTGVYYNHPHLSSNIFLNNTDKHGAGSNTIDDDENGFKNDYVGWDFVNGDAYPIDDNGHGTHVAGIVAGTLGGVAPKAKILPVKVLDAEGSGDLATIASGILYAIDRGAHIINLSLGGEFGTEITNEVKQLLNSITSAEKEGVLIVAAAGNGGDDGLGDCNDSAPIYPASFENEAVISVASVNLYNELSQYSNFGTTSVDIAAPGGDYSTGGILSTVIPDCSGPCSVDDLAYGEEMGTSMATPVVAGIAALIKAKDMSLTYKEIKEIIFESGISQDNLKNYLVTGKVVNAKNALDRI